jgi:hypothetical protein
MVSLVDPVRPARAGSALGDVRVSESGRLRVHVPRWVRVGRRVVWAGVVGLLVWRAPDVAGAMALLPWGGRYLADPTPGSDTGSDTVGAPRCTCGAPAVLLVQVPSGPVVQVCSGCLPEGTVLGLVGAPR